MLKTPVQPLEFGQTKKLLYCIVLYLLSVLNPKSYDGARVLEASGRPMLVIGRSYGFDSIQALEITKLADETTEYEETESDVETAGTKGKAETAGTKATSTAGTNLMVYLSGTCVLCITGGGLENVKRNLYIRKKKAPNKSPSSSSSFFFLLTALPPRASLQSFQTALHGLHWSSSGHSSTTCVPVMVSPHLQESVSVFLILKSHSFYGPLLVQH